MSKLDKQHHNILQQLVTAHADFPELVQFGSLVSANQYLRLYRLTAKYTHPNQHVLDWGAGNCHFSAYLLQAGYRVSAYSYNSYPKLAATFPAERFDFTNGLKDDPVTLPYPDETFDFVSSVGVLEHVRDNDGNEIGSLREIKRVLKPGGVFICFHLPNRYSWIEAGLRLTGRWSHKYRYTKKEIVGFADQVGLEILELQRYGAIPRNFFWWAFKGKDNSQRLATAYNMLDNALALPLAPIVQNFAFVARKPA